MAMHPEALIEKFAEMIEQADDDKAFAEKTVDILVMISMMDDSVSYTMEKINEKIRSLVSQAGDIKLQGRSQQYVANQIRELKESASSHVGLMH